MNTLFFEGTRKTPRINFDCSSGIFEFSGRSIPENPIEFYKPILDWLDEYTQFPMALTILKVQLEYFNTSSSKCILDVFKKFEVLHKQGHKVVIEWYYEEDDEDMLESGEDYRSIIRVPFFTKELN